VTPTSAPVFPPGRYGRRREPRRSRRLLVTALLVPVVLAALLITYTLYGRYGQPTFNPSAATATDLRDDSVTVVFTVHKAADETGTCRIRARDYHGSQVGFAVVPVGTGRTLRITYPLATSARAYVVEVLGCDRT
jgi:hypothetical protein